MYFQYHKHYEHLIKIIEDGDEHWIIVTEDEDKWKENGYAKLWVNLVQYQVKVK